MVQALLKEARARNILETLLNSSGELHVISNLEPELITELIVPHAATIVAKFSGDDDEKMRTAALDILSTLEPSTLKEVLMKSLVKYEPWMLELANAAPRKATMVNALHAVEKEKFKKAGNEWLAAWPGGDLDAVDGEGWSALQRAAAEGQSMAIAELLRRPKVEVNAVEPVKGQAALGLASRRGQNAAVRMLLASADVAVNQADQGGYTALHVAAEKGKMVVVQLLLSHPDIDPNRMNQEGYTPLFLAAYVGNVTIVELLLTRADIDVNLTGPLGRTPLAIAAQFGNEMVVQKLLAHPAVEVEKASNKG